MADPNDHLRLLRSQAIALFLDVDGTLLEIAATPDAVRLPDALLQILERVVQREAGALALVSGRSLSELDRLFAPHLFPAAGKHGSERRDHAGHVWRAPIDSSPLQTTRVALQSLIARHPGLLLEDKGAALAVHYRAVPELEPQVYSALRAAVAALEPQFQLKPGKCVLELAPAGYSKRTAIEAFMQETPFAGRIPVFIGDDVTDEDGFAAVNALGGYSIRVGLEGTSAARHRLSNVTAVIAWLRARYESPEAITK